MRSIATLAALVLVACAGSSGQGPTPMTMPGAEGELASLAWLAGSWSSSKECEVVEEHWTLPSTNMMLGMNRTVSQGTTKHHEQIRIEVRSNGIFYVASPTGQETTSFKLVERGEAHVVFENLQHDFPKRITYRRSGSVLRVRIEGNPGERVAEWTWQRSALPND